jgi:hypothetical protein
LPAERFEPGSGTGSIVRLGGNYDPIHRLCLGRDGKVCVPDVDVRLRCFNTEVWQRTPGTEEKLVMFGGLEQRCDDSSDCTDSHDRNSRHRIIMAGGAGPYKSPWREQSFPGPRTLRRLNPVPDENGLA